MEVVAEVVEEKEEEEEEEKKKKEKNNSDKIYQPSPGRWGIMDDLGVPQASICVV
jgi:hypothetical protein